MTLRFDEVHHPEMEYACAIDVKLGFENETEIERATASFYNKFIGKLMAAQLLDAGDGESIEGLDVEKEVAAFRKKHGL
jgi:hypothetical protein